MPVIGEVNSEHLYQRAKVYEDTTITWKICEFFTTVNSSVEKYLDSPRFEIREIPFYLRLFPRSKGVPDSTESCVILKCNVLRSFNVDYKFAIEKDDGTDENLASGKIIANQKFGRKTIYLSLPDMMLRKRNLLHGDDLHLKVLLQPDKFALNQDQNSRQLLKLDVLSDNFKNLLEEEAACDLIFDVQGKEFKVHRIVMIARSTVLKTILLSDGLERRTGIVKILDCQKKSFHHFVHYLYTGKIENLDVESAMELYYTSEKYNVQDLKTFCNEVMMKNLTKENLFKIAEFAEQYNEKKLKDKIRQFFDANSSEIFRSAEWKEFMM